jgi:hypothetical protein
MESNHLLVDSRRPTMRNDIHERAFVEVFILSKKRERYLTLLKTPGKRKRILDRLNHGDDIDPRFLRKVPADLQATAALVETLRRKGALTAAYMVSDDPELDQQELPLEDAIAKAVNSYWGTAVSCLPGKLAYYQTEAHERCYLLEASP